MIKPGKLSCDWLRKPPVECFWPGQWNGHCYNVDLTLICVVPCDDDVILLKPLNPRHFQHCDLCVSERDKEGVPKRPVISKKGNELRAHISP